MERVLASEVLIIFIVVTNNFADTCLDRLKIG